ncbi:MAG: radical SAM protein [Syntrophaceae bacterium]|nr:radical SAM protein [Syntrophaceae bacterium]
MNILVMNVSLRPQSPVKLFPIGLGFVTTAMKRAGFEFDLIDIDAHRYSDSEVRKRIQKKKYDVVCMGCIVTGYRIVKSLCDVIKEIHPHATIVVGNSVATSVAETLLKKTRADIAVMSEGDETIVELLGLLAGNDSLDGVKGISFLRDGTFVRNPSRPLIKDISSLPFIDFSPYDIDIYIDASKQHANDPLPMKRDDVRAMPVNTARGCIANCTFCYHVFKNSPYRFRNPDSIVAEIRELISRYSINYVLFWDELTFFSKKQTIALVDRLLAEDLDIYWAGSCRGNLFDCEEDLEIMEKMKKSGCVSMAYSLESSNPSILKMMNKHVSAEQFSTQTGLFHRAGIPVGTSIVMGYPQETPETIRRTFECCIENSIYPSAGYLLPQPGSKMYDYAVANGFIGDEEEYLLKMGDRQDLRLNMTSMSDEEFEMYVMEGLKRCNSLLEVGLDERSLIKTKHYRAGGKVLRA